MVVALLYHRVADLILDPQLLSVSISHFADHIDYLKRNFQPLSLMELKVGITRGSLPDKGVVITFDDGYIDNLHQAKPILEQYNVPATVFVVTGKIGDNHEFWWDELERLLLSTERLPGELHLTIDNRAYTWKLENSKGTNVFDPARYRGWNVTLAENPTPRHQIYRELCNLLRPLEDLSRQKILTELRNWAGLEESSSRFGYRAMTANELRSLCNCNNRLIEIGSHTQTHPLLSTLSIEMQKKEIEESKEHLETILGQEVISFSYPYGGYDDVNQSAIELVQKAGYELAFANVPGKITEMSKRYWLPRYIVRNWNVEIFKERLSGFFKL